MDKSKLQSGLFELLRGHLPKFERSARVTCLLSVRLDGSDDSSIFLEIAESLPAQNEASAASADATLSTSSAAATLAKAMPEKSKRKSQAPQKIVTNGEDSFVSEAAVANLPSLVSSGRASTSSSFNISTELSSAAVADQAVNLTSGSRSSGFLSPAQPTRVSTTPIKESSPAGRLGLGFFVNNSGFGQQHFLLPQGAGILAASVFPPSTALFQTTMLPQSVPPPAVSTTPPRPVVTEETPAESTPVDEDKKRIDDNGLPKLAIMPSNGSASLSQRSRSLFGLRSRRGGHKSFPCNQCHETFSSLAALSKHTYSNHKGYKCTFCSANFTQRSNLQRHSLKHVGFKPFACRCCQKSYYRKDHLVRHIEVTHPGKEPKKNIETKLSSAECLEFLERKYESGEYSITLDADADEEMPDGEEAVDGEEVVDGEEAVDGDEAADGDEVVDGEEAADGEAVDIKMRTEGEEDIPDAGEDKDQGKEEVKVAADEIEAAPTDEEQEHQPEKPSQLQLMPQPQPQPQPQLRRGQRRQPRRPEVTSESHAGMRLQIELPSKGSS